MSCNDEDADTQGKIVSKRDQGRWNGKGNHNVNKGNNKM